MQLIRPLAATDGGHTKRSTRRIGHASLSIIAGIMIDNWKNKRVTVMGLGRFGGGVGVTRWLAENGARVLLTDKAQPAELESALKQIADLKLELRLGEHRAEDFRDTDLLVVTPAVPDTNEFVRRARDAGVPVTTEINLFVERCRAACVGITGSVGKSTTTAMIGHVLERALPERRVWVGGNLGVSLLDSLADINERDVVVLELSSFQLARTAAVEWSPRVAVVTNITPNHIDWHGDFGAYVAAKLEILRFQQRERDTLILGDHADLRDRVRKVRGDLRGAWTYGLQDGVPTANCDGVSLRWENVKPAVPGRHNLENAAAALTVAQVLGVQPPAAATALTSFEGLEHRLQRVAVSGGVTYYNDSKSTTPESAITALNAIETPLLIILGGYDKKSDLTCVAEITARRTKFAACIGVTGLTLCEKIRAAGGRAELFETLAAAVKACRGYATSGDSVLLSPACASWDMFSDYRQRGEEFTRLVRG